jgi:hypothetical protein
MGFMIRFITHCVDSGRDHHIKGSRHVMKQFAFYLKPHDRQIHRQSLTFFTVIVSDRIENAVQKFAELQGSDYCGMVKIKDKQYHVFFTLGRAPEKEEFMYIVIENEKLHFDAK